jgi:hypothetical protein
MAGRWFIVWNQGKFLVLVSHFNVPLALHGWKEGCDYASEPERTRPTTTARQVQIGMQPNRCKFGLVALKSVCVYISLVSVVAVVMADPIRISADEINCLIYAYLQDSGAISMSFICLLVVNRTTPGFTHSAFAIRMEGHLERSPYLSKHIPRGELVELLSKSLLYLEVESHWKGDALTSNCKSGFSLLEPHVCSLEAPNKVTLLPATPHIPISVAEPKINGTSIEPNGKRKTSPVAIEGPTEKRAKRDQEDMDVDSSSECMISRILLISFLIPINTV